MTNQFKTIVIIIFSLGFIAWYFPQNDNPVNNSTKVMKRYLLGQVNASKDTAFMKVMKPFTDKPDIYMQTSAYRAYKKMYLAAANQGINLKIVSAFRSFNHQKAIWEAKWTGRRKVLGQNLSKKYPNAEQRAKVILMFSAMPGTSRHHWGTDIDIYSVEDEDFQSGKGKQIYEWLKAHASDYGFCQVYTPKIGKRSTGYEEEKWHWSYKPVAQRNLKYYQRLINYQDIIGFKGDRTAKKIKVIQNYVLGINPDCR